MLPKSVDQGEEEVQSTSSQPPTYPSLKPLSHPTPIQHQSPQEDFMRLSAATTKALPKGERKLFDCCIAIQLYYVYSCYSILSTQGPL